MANGDTTTNGIYVKMPSKGRQAAAITLPVALVVAAICFLVRYSRSFGQVESEFGAVKGQVQINTTALSGINSRLDRLESKQEARHEAIMESLRRLERTRDRGNAP